MAAHPNATVVQIGTGLNTRFERVDNGTVHWIDMDLPDTIELRRMFFTDTDRRRMIAASVTDEGWLETVRESPGGFITARRSGLRRQARARSMTLPIPGELRMS